MSADATGRGPWYPRSPVSGGRTDRQRAPPPPSLGDGHTRCDRRTRQCSKTKAQAVLRERAVGGWRDSRCPQRPRAEGLNGVAVKIKQKARARSPELNSRSTNTPRGWWWHPRRPRARRGRPPTRRRAVRRRARAQRHAQTTTAAADRATPPPLCHRVCALRGDGRDCATACADRQAGGRRAAAGAGADQIHGRQEGAQLGYRGGVGAHPSQRARAVRGWERVGGIRP